MEPFIFGASTLLIDIEGEHKIFDESYLSRIGKQVIIVRLHDLLRDQEFERIFLLEREKKSHHPFLLSTGARNLSGIHE